MTSKSSAGPGLSAVVLAAGASQRFSGEPKALLAVGDETVAARIVRIAQNSGCDPVIAVVGAHGRALRPVFTKAGAVVVENPDWEAGRTGSVQVGIGSAPEGDDILLWPVDHPFVEAESVIELLDAARRDELAVWAIPSYRSQGGHPVFLRAAVLSRIGSLSPGVPLRTLIPMLGVQVMRVAVNDPGVAEAVDTPELYHEYLARWLSRELS